MHRNSIIHGTVETITTASHPPKSAWAFGDHREPLLVVSIGRHRHHHHTYESKMSMQSKKQPTLCRPQQKKSPFSYIPDPMAHIRQARLCRTLISCAPYSLVLHAICWTCRLMQLRIISYMRAIHGVDFAPAQCHPTELASRANSKFHCLRRMCIVIQAVVYLRWGQIKWEYSCLILIELDTEWGPRFNENALLPLEIVGWDEENNYASRSTFLCK